MFYVCDENFNELDSSYGNVWFTTEKAAQQKAYKLSIKFPDEVFNIGCACSSCTFKNGIRIDL